ncbi:MAG: hypothetical protein E7608_04680 [Ruminococcaceae bacterium]|nr:hypothetical protein [Oscillospiraceae bacterium]
MGFGYMFLGCFLLTGAFDTLNIFGFLLMYAGINAASNHCTCFDNTKKVCALGLVFSGIKAVLGICSYFDIELTGAGVNNIINSTYTAYMLCFYVFLFLSVAAVAKDTELFAIMKMAYTNIMLVPIFLVAGQVIMVYITMNAESIGDLAARLYGTGLLLSLLVTVLTAILLFRCYARICLEGDEDMEKKVNNFKSPLDYYEKNKKSGASAQKNNTHKKKKK